MATLTLNQVAQVGSLRKRAWIAVGFGSCVSVVLFLLSYATHSLFLTWLQVIGFFICILIRGIDSATKTDYVVISIPINAAIYALMIFGITTLWGRWRGSSCPTPQKNSAATSTTRQ